MLNGQCWGAELCAAGWPRALCPHAAAWALQRIGEHNTDKEHLAAAAAGLRTLVVPSNQVGNLADLAWSLSQHPRARFAVCVNAGLDNHSGSAAVADTAAMLSGQAWRHAGAPGFEMLGGWGPVLCLPACCARL